MQTTTEARTPEGEIIALPAYQVALIEKINALPPLERKNLALAIGGFCLAVAEGFRAGDEAGIAPAYDVIMQHFRKAA